MRRTLLFVLLVHAVMGAQYAVLVAGSNGYWNYRHQADVCHAYHTLLNHGFDPSNIILFSYDDVQSASSNPFPGQLFNHPGNFSADVNAGCKKDYIGEAVNASNFLAVITGNASAVKGGNGRVLNSGPNDNVFINFVDHGAPGLVAFPDTYLYADQLNTSLTYMYTHGMYKQLVFYLEACESGSMFSGILSNAINVYALTAAGTDDPSWVTYCYPNDAINGTDLYTCLGDLFSVSWMEDSDAADFSIETLQEQYLRVQKRTNISKVSEFGVPTIEGETLNQFQGPNNAEAIIVESDFEPNWNAYDAKLMYLYSVFTAEPTDANTQALIEEISYEQSIVQTFQLISQYLNPTGEENLFSAKTPVADFACLRASVATFEMQCGRMQDYTLQYVQVLVNACEAGHSLAQMDGAVSQACSIATPDLASLPLAYWGLDTYLKPS